MRRLLLWMAGNRWLRDRLPRLWFTRRAVRQFMPGEDVNAALAAGPSSRSRESGQLYTRLGENLTRIEEADEVAAALPGRPRRPARAAHGRRDLGEAHPAGLRSRRGADASATLDLAARPPDGADLWVDMEGSAYTEAPSPSTSGSGAAHPNTGICLQAYLRRTRRGRPATAPARSGDPPGQGRLRRAGIDRLPRPREVDANYVGLAVRSCSTAAAGRSGSGSAPTTSG